MARRTPGQNQAETDSDLPHRVTIVGRDVPSSYEISVDGEIMMVDAEHCAEATIGSGGTAEGTIEVGVDRFRFSGQLANVHLVDWNGVPAPASPSPPDVHIDYGVRGRSNSR